MCQKELDPKFIYFNAEGYNALAIYEYSEYIRNLIYLYKGCFDYDMKDAFLNLFVKEMKRQTIVEGVSNLFLLGTLYAIKNRVGKNEKDWF